MLTMMTMMMTTKTETQVQLTPHIRRTAGRPTDEKVAGKQIVAIQRNLRRCRRGVNSTRLYMLVSKLIFKKVNK